jgi:Na+/phosphate symporter
LVMAGLLIALGTSLKLPLSTTYVAFMVAMGTSLADRAWGRESAVFRITGVLSVIGGWFITAGAAFTFCFLVVLVMYYGGMIATVALVILAIILLIRSNIKYNKKKKAEKTDNLFNRLLASKDKEEIRSLLSQHIANNEADYMDYVAQLYQQVTDGFINEDLKNLRRADSSLKNKKTELKKIRRKEMIGMRRIDKELAIEKNTWFHLASNSTQQILYCLRRICEPCEEHVDNNFSPIAKERVKEFVPLRDTLIYLLNRTKAIIINGNYKEVDEIRSECDKLKEALSRTRKLQMNRMQDEKDNLAVSYVYLNMLQESQELVSSLRHLLRATRSFQTD